MCRFSGNLGASNSWSPQGLSRPVQALLHISHTCTGHFIIFSMITDICNKKNKGPTLMELFTATGTLKKFFFWQLEMFYVCTTGDTAHIDKIFKSLSHTRQLRSLLQGVNRARCEFGGRSSVFEQVCTQWWWKFQSARSYLAAVNTQVTKKKSCNFKYIQHLG